MQDGGDERPRGGATSALEDGHARSADGFGRKSTDDTAVAVLEPAAPAPATKPDDAPRKAAPEQTKQPAAAAKPAGAATAATVPQDAGAPTATKQVGAEVRMSDGAVYEGTIYILEDDRVLDFLNKPIPFFALTENSGKVRLLSKAQVMQIVPYDKSDPNAASSRGGGALM